MKALSCAVLLSACSTTVYYTPLQSSPRPFRTPPPIVDVLTREPSRPFVTIGILELVAGSDVGSEPFAADLGQELLERLRVEAARRGCDALLLHPPPGGRGAAAYRGGCIVFTDGATASR